MKKFLKTDLIRPKASRSESQDAGADTPEANIARAIKAFCEAGRGKKQPTTGPDGVDTSQVDEVTYLPTIVDLAESSPTAAKEAAYTIRKQLDSKNSKHGYQQYNALMLLRILVDNPGPTFTRNMDAKFLSAIKETYRGGKDPSVRQLLAENLEYFSRKDDPNLQAVKEWYVKERESGLRAYGQAPPLPRGTVGTYPGPAGHTYGGTQRRSKNALPTPEELAARIAEAQTSAKLLMQILQSTPTSEILANQLITEFADRCSAASRSIQIFIEADSPGPDESTMLTLFETNEQLATSLSRHQLAVFSAKQALKGDASRTNSGNQVPQLSTPSPQPRHQSPPTMTAPVHSTSPGPIPEPVGDLHSGLRTSPSPPTMQRPYPPPPPLQQQQQQQQQPDNPFSDNHAQPTPYQAWRPDAQDQQQSLYTGGYNVSPVGQEAQSQSRHPMADVSPVATTAPQQMPHGYQPYRY